MKVTLGYYDAKGCRIRAQHPKPGSNFYLVMGTIRKRICEDDEASPYKDREVAEYNSKFCDRKRMVVEISLFARGRFKEKVSIWGWGSHHRIVDKIRENINKRKTEISKQYKIKLDRVKFT